MVTKVVSKIQNGIKQLSIRVLGITLLHPIFFGHISLSHLFLIFSFGSHPPDLYLPLDLNEVICVGNELVNLLGFCNILFYQIQFYWNIESLIGLEQCRKLPLQHQLIQAWGYNGSMTTLFVLNFFIFTPCSNLMFEQTLESQDIYCTGRPERSDVKTKKDISLFIILWQQLYLRMLIVVIAVF